MTRDELPGCPQVSLRDTDRDTEILGRTHLGVRPLTDYFSHSPTETAAFLTGEGHDPTGVDLPPEQWFQAAEGLAIVRALLREPDQLPGKKGAVADDLREFEVLLVRLNEGNTRWHLAVDF